MTAVNPKDFLHLVAVLFMGSDDLDSSVDSLTLAVSEETMQACFENHPLLASSTFTRHTTAAEDAEDIPSGAEDGSNLQSFKDLLSAAGRDNEFVEVAVQTLYRLDKERAQHEDIGHTGIQTIGMGAIIGEFENSGWDDDRLDLLEESPTLRDGLRAYAKLSLNLLLPETKKDLANERKREHLGDDRPGWETIMERHPSFEKLSNAGPTIAEEIAEIEAGGSVEDLRNAHVDDPPDEDGDRPSGLTHGPVEPSVLPITRYVLHAPDPPHPVVTAALEAATARANARERQLMDYTELSAILLPVLLHLVDRDGNDLDALRELSQLLYSSKVPKLAAILWPLLDDELRDELGWEEASELEAALVRQDQSSLFTAADAGTFRDRIQERRAAIKAAATP